MNEHQLLGVARICISYYRGGNDGPNYYLNEDQATSFMQ